MVEYSWCIPGVCSVEVCGVEVATRAWSRPSMDNGHHFHCKVIWSQHCNILVRPHGWLGAIARATMGTLRDIEWRSSWLFESCYTTPVRLQFLCESWGEQAWDCYKDAQRVSQSPFPLLVFWCYVTCFLFATYAFVFLTLNFAYKYLHIVCIEFYACRFYCS
jgi:hypothetical protein